MKHCISLLSSRAICESAINGLKRAFDVDESGTIGYSHAGGTKIISASEANEAAYSPEIEWLGVVDGKHSHRALSELEYVRPDPFQDFKWVVIVINWQPIPVLTAFARARNTLQVTNVVEMTLYDTIFGLHEVALGKAMLCGETLENYAKQRGAITQIADDFWGGSRCSRQTTRTLAGAALRIKPRALEVLGQIMTEKDSPLARRILARDNLVSVREQDIFDARAYKNIISTNTIRGASVFLNADVEDQSNALRKLKFCYEENGFKCFQASRLNKETERSARARHQIHLLNRLLCRDKWPEELSDGGQELLMSSHFKTELGQHGEACDTILPSLVNEYRLRMPLEAGLRWRLYCEERARTNQAAEMPSGNQTQEGRQSENSNSSMDNGTMEGGTEWDSGDSEPGAGQPCPLERLEVKCLNLTLESYLLARKTEDDKFDLIAGDPTQLQLNGTCKDPIDERQADKYAGIFKKLIRFQRWVFLYTRAVDYALWDKAFRATGFEPLDYPWVMVRNTDTVASKYLADTAKYNRTSNWSTQEGLR